MSDYPQGPIEVRSEGREGRRGSSGALFAITLIVLGAASLMGNMGIAAINWAEAARYWPVLLILLGLDLMIGRRSMLGSGVMAVVTLVALLGVFWLSSQTPVETSPPSRIAALFPPARPASGDIEEKLGGARKLEVNVELSQMALTLGSLDDGSLAAQGDWSTVEGLEPEISYEVEDGTGVLTIRQPDTRRGIPPFAVDSLMKLNLPPGIPIELNVHNDLGAVTLDLSKLQVTTLDAGASSGNQAITLPEAGQMQTVTVKGDLGSVSVKAPDKATLNMDALDVSSSSGNLTVALPGKGTIGDLSVKGDLGAVTVTIPDDATLEIGPADFESSSGNLAVALPAQGKVGEVTISCDLGSITLSISGASNMLSVEKLDINASSGNVDVTLPGQGNYPVDIQNDLGSVTVAFPSTLEVYLSIDAGLTKPTISSDRLKPVGDLTWNTADYGTGDHRALVTIQASSGRVEVKDQQ